MHYAYSNIHESKALIQMIMGIVVGVVAGVIGIQIVSDTLQVANFTGTLKTVTDNVPIFMGLGLLALGAAVAAVQFLK